ncbi:MAG: hypothetical protein COB38_08085 [Gammaproteobacteria bacterium]|nr:MAG: hypothetical protein COB38_08085 [Gammaproteobacteria bacterium]
MDIITKIYIDDENSSSRSPSDVQSSAYLFRGALFGDGFFTTAVVRNSRIINKERHLSRLEVSSKRLKFSQWSSKEIASSMDKIAIKYPDSILRISCSRKQKERGYAFSANATIECEIAVQKLKEFPYETCHLKMAETPISVNKMLAGIKHLNRLDNVMASSECEAPNQEVLMCDDERVICGSRSNLFVKLDGEWMTPIISDCGINGVAQGLVIEKMDELGISCKHKDIVKTDLKKMTASFVTNSIVGIWPAESFINLECDIYLKLDLDCVLQLKSQLELVL